MKIGPKYKIARRLGAPVFEKTQTQKFAVSQARREKSSRTFSRPKSEYGSQLLEKQKARYTYCLTEKQFSRYAKNALAKKDTNASSRLYENLELRADNVAFRAGFAPTRLSAKQLISHGHMLINDKRITTPSYKLSVGNSISIRPNSKDKALFSAMEDRLKTYSPPIWIKFDQKTKTASIQSLPKQEGSETLFDFKSVLEFYSR
jgi:small subunit ribosomal protein S4